MGALSVTEKDVQQGSMETTCRACGRHEAAGWYCTWCGQRSAMDDWYPNNNWDERSARMPKVAPASPPPEYRQGAREDGRGGWPESWGPSPYQRGPRSKGTPLKAEVDPGVVSVPAKRRGRPPRGS